MSQVYITLEELVAAANLGLTLQRVDNELDLQYGAFITANSEITLASELGDSKFQFDRDNEQWMVRITDEFGDEESDS